MSHGFIPLIYDRPSPEEQHARLGRGPNEKPYLLIPVGYPAAGCLVPDIRMRSVLEVTTVLEGKESPRS